MMRLLAIIVVVLALSGCARDLIIIECVLAQNNYGRKCN